MVEVVGFKVDVVLKVNDSHITGVISKVVDKNLFLENGAVIKGGDIKDLKVVDVPKEMKKKKKQSLKKKDYQSSNNGAYVSNYSTPTNNGQYSDITWAGDDNINNIKNTGDFDFEKSTADFDKIGALSEFALNDNVDSSKRLVGHNKLKTKYDNDENVLSKKIDNWDNKSSNNVDVAASKALTDLIKSGNSTISKRSPSLEIRGYHFVSSLNTKETLPLATPIQLLEIERLSNETFKMPPSLIAENASKGISSLIIKILGGSSRIHNLNHNLPPLVLLLIGNNRAGARAIATGRQLTNQGIRVIAFTLQELDSLDDELVKFQLELFTLSGGKHITSSVKSLTNYLKTIDSPIELIVDALQGYDTHISDLWGEELEVAKSIISWTNKQIDINKVSLDIPSGFDAGSGLISDIEPIDSKLVVSLGLPLNGLLHAYSNGVITKYNWNHYLIDIGIPAQLFKKGSLRKFDRNWFGGDWSIQLEIEEK